MYNVMHISSDIILSRNKKDIQLLCLIILGFLYLVLLGKLFVDVITKKNHFFYEKWSKTENKNETVKK